jgi:hypothetical protein
MAGIPGALFLELSRFLLPEFYECIKFTVRPSLTAYGTDLVEKSVGVGIGS